MKETWVRSVGQEDLLEKGMANHSHILVWKILWIEESGKLQSMGAPKEPDMTLWLNNNIECHISIR